MIKNYIIHANNGQIIRTGSCTDESFEIQTLPNESIVEGVANQQTQYIVDGEIVDLPTKPEGEFYHFDYDLQQWVQDLTALSAKILYNRNKLLINSDWTQLQDVPLTNKAEWAAYRQKLRDIPEQTGYPINVIWPVAPAD